MKSNSVIVSMLAAVALIGTGCTYDQPSVGCPVQRVNWNARYTLVSSTGSGTCNTLVGENIGFQRYNNPQDPNGEQLVAMRPVRLAGADAAQFGDYGNNAVSANSAALSTLAQDPEGEFCKTGAFSPAAQTIGGVNRRYEYKDVEFYVTASAPGSQMRANLTYTETSSAGVTCVAEYKVDAVWPANMVCGDTENPVTHLFSLGNPVETKCDFQQVGPEGETIQTRFVNPDFDLECKLIAANAAGVLQPRCVPAKAVPSLL